MIFDCPICGATHDLAALSLGTDAPEQWYLLSESERGASLLSQDQCVIEAEGETSSYVRACLDVPIVGTRECFKWGVWASLSEASFDEVHEHWEHADRSRLGPYFGWLSTEIPGYESMFLKTRVHIRPPGLRPIIEVHEDQGLIAKHQRDGLPLAELIELIVPLLHVDD